MKQLPYYTLDKILQQNARYNFIFGERTNGKTYAVDDYALKNYLKTGEQMAVVRRFDEDFMGGNALEMFTGQLHNGKGENNIVKLTKGKYNAVSYRQRKYFLTNYDENGAIKETDQKPFGYAFAITKAEHYKSSSYPLITTVLFDEAITRKYYLPNEFIDFMDILSTIIRLRTNVKIFMLGNTVNKYCPYFAEMGLKNVKNMERGKIDLYTYSDSKLRVAVEYSDFPTTQKKSNVYFAFNNPKLEMIRTGAWEIASYPHLPVKYFPTDIIYKYYIVFDEETLQCNIIKKDGKYFTYIHRKTTEIKDDKAIVYTQKYDYRPNYRRRITNPRTDIEKRICEFFARDKVFYQDNDVGEVVRNYLMWSKKATEISG